MTCSGRLLDTMPSSAYVGKGDMDMHLEGFVDLERRLGYKFRDHSFLLQAITHASYSSNRVTDCYQRLEFLGDAVLGTAPQTLTWNFNSAKQHTTAWDVRFSQWCCVMWWVVPSVFERWCLLHRRKELDPWRCDHFKLWEPLRQWCNITRQKVQILNTKSACFIVLEHTK